MSFVPLYTTNFYGPDQNPFTDAGLWVSSGGGSPAAGLQTISSLCYGNVAVAQVCEAHLIQTISADQYAEVTVGPLSGGGFSGLGPGIRHAGAYTSGYTALVQGSLNNPGITVFNMYKSFVSMGAPVTNVNISIGDKVRIAAVGSTLTAYINGVALLSHVDSTYLSGFVSIDLYADTVIQNAGVSRFEAGIITSSGTPYSVPDCRNYGTFPNVATNVNGTLTYTTPSNDSRTQGIPTDSRAVGAPVASGTYPQNSRTPGTYGPGE